MKGPLNLLRPRVILNKMSLSVVDHFLFLSWCHIVRVRVSFFILYCFLTNGSGDGVIKAKSDKVRTGWFHLFNPTDFFFHFVLVTKSCLFLS